MPFDPELDDRLSAALKGRKGFERKKMFGGTGYMLSGNICVGVYREFLILRLGPEKFEELSAKYDELRPMDITGKPMKGWGMIDGAACDASEFDELVAACEGFVRTLQKQ
ncbi:MAG: RNA methyltransferase [Alphaproteobacteria bacterium]|nr:RNA methyltransferase [Alphaproteobacteria bacterium]